MLDQFTHVTFAPLVGKTFRVILGDTNVLELELIEAFALPARPSATEKVPRQHPFSLVFRGPPDRFLPQQTYALEHEALGKFDLFLVPIAPDPNGYRYEAIFN